MNFYPIFYEVFASFQLKTTFMQNLDFRHVQICDWCTFLTKLSKAFPPYPIFGTLSYLSPIKPMPLAHSFPS